MPTTFAPATLTINLHALAHNYTLLKNAGSPAKCAAVVKANAYGLGINHVARTLWNSGCKSFFVANLDEAIELRNLLAEATIYVFFGIQQGEEEIFVEHNITPVLNTIEQIKSWNKHSHSDTRLRAIIHIDTGMNRLGLNMQDGFGLSQNPQQFENLKIDYIMSHLACISELDHPKNTEQITKFSKIREWFPDTPVTFNNSGGTLNSVTEKNDLVRPGISLYGSNSVADSAPPLKNVITLTSKIIQTRTLETEQSIGYGATATLPAGSLIATVPVGYADGYPRMLGNQAVGYINGQYIPLIGRVSMDSIMFDVSEVVDIKNGDTIELIGSHITVDDVAHRAQTIGYEILTNLGKRYKRIYIDE